MIIENMRNHLKAFYILDRLLSTILSLGMPEEVQYNVLNNLYNFQVNLHGEADPVPLKVECLIMNAS